MTDTGGDHGDYMTSLDEALLDAADESDTQAGRGLVDCTRRKSVL